MSCSAPGKTRGFSLTELLVIEGIIALLIALLVPALVRARRHAIDMKCLVQLRQIGIAMSNYASLNRGAYPAFSTHWQLYHAEGQPGDSPGPGWPERLDSFLPGGEKNYDCPAFGPELPFNYFLSARWTYLRHRRSLRLSEVKWSSEFFIVADTLTIHAYPHPLGDNSNSTNDCDKDDGLGPLLFFPNDADTFSPHADGTHLLFADSHVAAFKEFDRDFITCDPQNQGRAWSDISPP